MTPTTFSLPSLKTVSRVSALLAALFFIAALPALPRRIFWVDSASADSATRHALARAFDEAALYSDDVRAASAHRPPARAPKLRLASVARPRPHAAARRSKSKR